MFLYKVYLYWVIFLFFFFFFFLMGFYFLMNDCSIMLEYSVFGLGGVEFIYLILIDWVSMFFCSLIMIISSMVVLYSWQYMGFYSYSMIRFLYLVILFILSMFLMIISPNLISIMLGWDGLGLVSFCLVVYYNSLSSYLSGIITCLTNRLGDIGILICIGWVVSYGGWHFIFNSFIYNSEIYYLIFISSFTKSAQIPFSCWLPAAMAAPTPVSALVHSSTLVTAGVYLLIRFFNVFFYLNYLFLFISFITIIMSSFCALFEFDLKSVVAYSTLSQLGLMMFSLFMGLVDLSYFHLLSHAVFKSLLFLCSGIFIYFMGDVQDIRMMSSMSNVMPLTSSCFNISWLSLCGIPFLSGFYSKDLLIEYSLSSGLNLLIYILVYISLCLTMFYSLRLFYYSMIVNSGFCMYFIGDSFDLMKFSVFFLSLLSVFFGCFFNWVVGFDVFFIYFPLYIKFMIIIFIFLSFWLVYEFISFNFIFSVCYVSLNSSMWFINGFVPYMYMYMYMYSKGLVDFLFWGEYYGLMGLCLYFPYLSNFLQWIFLGGFNYILFMMGFSLLFMF
uniref:NADH:ubiquinone reductase (H(+)-translocating) n=1 Tax=Olidiana tongmaiensis TaxID=2501809 RepID=A0A898P8K3_9HEMI|nr:NADH dehydrogenase subunit 5 [Olidiana tongmaiensis]QSJ61401.1 NADH dehydrogenase subunit 5 [Olidiana tongmaiensis]